MADVAGARPAPGRGRSRAVRAAVTLAAVAVVVWAGFHLSAVGASWSRAWQLIGDLSLWWLAGLTVVWLLGLVVHTTVLTGSLPGLRRHRALALNLAGSAVSNVLPLGGLAGTALNLRMVRAWGHTSMDFARFVVVSKAWDVVAKLVMPLVTVLVLLGCGVLAPGGSALLWLLLTAAGAAVGLLVVIALLGRAKPLLRVVAIAERGRARLRRMSWRRGAKDGRPAPGTAWTDATMTLLEGTDRLVRRTWAELSWGMAGYWLLQGALLALCLHVVGAHLRWPLVLAALAAERVGTLLAITPGGSGLTEAAAITVLIALGGDPTRALAGIVLFRGFVFAAEIPVGGVAAVAWLATRRRVA
jgi:putative heme transporter